MKTERFTFDSRDGKSRIHAIRWSPEGEVKLVLQIVHGMTEHITRYEHLAEYMTEKGILVTGEDHLGHGETGKEQGIFGYFCEKDPATVVVRDVHRLKKITQEAYPGVPYYILGHSMGSFIVRNYIFRYGKGIDGAIIMGTGQKSGGTLAFGKALAAVLGVLQGKKSPCYLLEKIAFGNSLKRIENPKTKSDWLCCDEEVIARYKSDKLSDFTFTVNGYQTLFELISRAVDEKNARLIPADLPVFFMSGKEDPVGDYGKGVKAAYEMLKQAGVKDVSIKLYPGDRHEIVNEADKEVVFQDIYRWLIRQGEK